MYHGIITVTYIIYTVKQNKIKMNNLQREIDELMRANTAERGRKAAVRKRAKRIERQRWLKMILDKICCTEK